MLSPLPSTLLASDNLTLAWVGTSATFSGDSLGSCVNSELYEDHGAPGGGIRLSAGICGHRGMGSSK